MAKYLNDIEATGFVKTNGTSNEILCADGSTTEKITKTSQLTNDSDFATKSEIPTKEEITEDCVKNIDGVVDIENSEIKNVLIENVDALPTTNHITSRVVTSATSGRQKLYLNIGNGWDVIVSEFYASSNFIKKSETGNIMYNILDNTTSDIIASTRINLNSSMLYHRILLNTNAEQIDSIVIPLTSIYANITTTSAVRLKNKKFIVDFPNAIAGDYSKATGSAFIVDFGNASDTNDRYEPLEFHAFSNTSLVPELHFTLVSNNTRAWIDDVY